MKVCVVYHDFNKTGGISRVVVEIVEGLVERGHEVHLVTSRCKHKIDGLVVHEHPLVWNPYFLRVGLNPILNTRIVDNLNRKHSFDVVYGHGTELFSQDVLVAHSCHKAVVEKFKKERGAGYSLMKNFDLQSNIISAVENHQYTKHKYKKITSVSDLIKRELVDCYRIPEEDVAVVHNGVNLEEFNPNKKGGFRREIEEKYGLSEKDILLLFVANEFKRKGLECAVKALDELKDKKVKLLVAGGDNEKPYLKLAARLGVADQLRFLGKVRDVKRFYSACDVFVFPTVYEPFGLVVLEALASGLPAVVSRCAGASELLTDGVDSLLLDDPRSVEELADKLRGLVGDEQLRRRMASSARTTAEKHSWGRVVDETLKVFEEVASK